MDHLINSQYTRNFSIIAHIDHGKSTLADRFLEQTRTVSDRDMVSQVLDSMDLEREKGITIKSHAITMKYDHPDGNTYNLNLIDTPGHVDFSYEVSRSLAACEGAILIVDAAQGVEAQTVSNLFQALEHDLTIIPVINKIDLPIAQIEMVKEQIIDLIGCDENEILLTSAKNGTGVSEVLNAIVNRVPSPQGKFDDVLRALIFDSYFDPYRGAVALVRIFDGEVQTGDQIQCLFTGKSFEVQEVGLLQLQHVVQPKLSAGQVGYIIAGMKDVSDTRVGDTITKRDFPAKKPLPGYQEPKPMVFSGLFPADVEDFERLKYSLEKLQLNDASLSFEPETSMALGFGFRCGFLGMLHMNIVQERLEREYNLNLVTTVPNVEYHVYTRSNGILTVDNPVDYPPVSEIDHVEEPYIDAQIIAPAEYIGSIMKLTMERRGIYKNTTYPDRKRISMHFHLPLSEIVFDFYDRLKSMTRGFASFDYEFLNFRHGDLVKLDLLVNGDPVDALSTIVHKQKAYEWGKRLCQKLRELIPRQLFEVAIQAAIGNQIIARETVKPMRKNVTGKCYGGDITRKRKLWEKQNEGKKRMKQVGKIEIPQDAFLAVLQVE